MKVLVALFVITFLGTSASAGVGYTCLLLPTHSARSMSFIIYNGSGDAVASKEAHQSYEQLVKSHPELFKKNPPRIVVTEYPQQALSAFVDTYDDSRWHGMIVIGDRTNVYELLHDGVNAIAFVPSQAIITQADRQAVETASGKSYYSIAIDHALRRSIRMAAGTDPKMLFEVTAGHIIHDIQSSSN